MARLSRRRTPVINFLSSENHRTPSARRWCALWPGSYFPFLGNIWQRRLPDIAGRNIAFSFEKGTDDLRSDVHTKREFTAL